MGVVVNRLVWGGLLFECEGVGEVVWEVFLVLVCECGGVKRSGEI